MQNISNKKYWDQHWQDVKVHQKPTNHPLMTWLEKSIPITKDQSCFEIGCYPGKFLNVLGEKGYELNGIDISERVPEMADYFKSEGFRVGNFIQKDFLKYKSDDKYDIVCSFGFIEHFDDWEAVINKHLDMTRKGGICIIEVPNLNSSIYKFLYRTIEPEVLDNHNLKAMSLGNIKRHMLSCNNKIVTADHLGHFYFRFVTKTGKKYKNFERFINSFRFVIDLLPKSLSARYIGVIVEK